MKSDIGSFLSVVAVLCMAVPAQAFNEPVAATAKAPISDVVLSDAGDFLGLVVADDGTPRVNVAVGVYHNDTMVAQARTDASGRYYVRGLRSGMHVVRTSTTEQACRFWNPQTAPPSARQALVTSNETSVRGQYACGEDCCGDSGEGCGGDCGRSGCRGGLLGGGILGGGAFGGASIGTLAAVGAFAAVTATTVATTTKSDKTKFNSGAPPASP